MGTILPSPTTGRIVYRETTGGTIAIMNADGTGSTSLGVVGNEPEMSADGTKIVFSRWGAEPEDGSIHTWTPTARTSRRSATTSITIPRFRPTAPRSSSPACAARPEIPPPRLDHGPDGTDPVNVAPNDESEMPQYSPDGTKLVFSVYDDDGSFRQIATMPSGGGAFTVIEADIGTPGGHDRQPVPDLVARPGGQDRRQRRR